MENYSNGEANEQRCLRHVMAMMEVILQGCSRSLWPAGRSFA